MKRKLSQLEAYVLCRCIGEIANNEANARNDKFYRLLHKEKQSTHEKVLTLTLDNVRTKDDRHKT